MRSKTIYVTVCTLDSEVENNLLGGALRQWNDAAQMTIAQQLQFSLALEHFLHIATDLSSSPSNNNTASETILQGCEKLEQLNCPQLFEHALKMLRCLLFSLDSTSPVSPAPNETEMADFNAYMVASIETLKKAVEEVKYWLRKTEKQAEDAPSPMTSTTTHNGTPSPPPIPCFFSNALQLLWSVMETKYIPKYESFQVDLRSLVCKRYQAVDQSLLAAVSDSLGDGDRLPAQDMPGYDKLYGELIGKSYSMIGEMCGQDDEVRQAMRLLYSLDHLLLANQGGSGVSSSVVASVVDVNVQQMLLMAVVETLLEGNAPSIAVPLLTDIFQETLKESAVIKLDADTKLKLIPRIVTALTGNGNGNNNSSSTSGKQEPSSSSSHVLKGRVLRDKDAVVLLKATLDPDALLESGRLSEFQFVFLLLLKYAQESSSMSSNNMSNTADAVAPLLMSFDTLRFAILAMQHQASSRRDDISANEVSLQSVLDTAAQCLLTSHSYSSSTEAAGTSIVEGVLSSAPIEAYAACLALALHTPSSIARSNMLSMLGTVPADMLPEYTIVEILHQVAAALEDDRLKLGELPQAMVAALFKTVPVMSSLHDALYDSNTYRGGALHHPQRHGASSSALLQNVWTAQILHGSNGSKETTTSSTFQAQQNIQPSIIPSMWSAEAEEAVGGSSSASACKQHVSNSDDSINTLMSRRKQEDVLAPKIRLMQNSRRSIKMSEISMAFDTFLKAWLQWILRHTAGTSEGDARLSESLGNVLVLLFEPAAEQGAWMLEWIWKVAYLKHLHRFLNLTSAATGTSTAIHVFRQYWASLPWKKATFHLDGVSELSRISTLLLSSGGESRAAAELLHALDWAPIISKCPTPGDNNKNTTISAPLICLDEEEEATQLGLLSTAAIWAANLSLLALRVGILFPKQDLPPWLQLLVYGDNIGALVELLDATMLEKLVPFLQQAAVVNKQQRQGSQGSGKNATPLSILLQYSDWPTLHVAFQLNVTKSSNAPWLLLPIFTCSKIIDSNCGSRLAHIATVLAEGALLHGTTASTQQQYHAAYVASAATQPVLLNSVCHGSIVPQPTIAYQDQQQQLQTITVPNDIPSELLEGTEEGRQLKLQQEQEQLHPWLRVATTTAIAGGGGGNASPQPSSDLQCIEVSGCFRLSVEDDSYILSNALLPLAQKAASIGLISKIIDENTNDSSSSLVSNAGSRVKMWQPMSEEEELGEEENQQLMMTMTPMGEHTSSSPPIAPPLVISKDEAAISIITSLLAAVSISSASTYITAQPVAGCSNADVPWDQEAALFLCSDGRPISPPSTSTSLFGNGLVEGLSRRFTGLLGMMHAAGSNGEGSLVTGDDATNTDTTHHHVYEHSIMAIEHITQLVNWLCMVILEYCCSNDDGRGSNELLLCLVRLIYVAASPSESTSQLGEALLRHLKTVESTEEGRQIAEYETLFALHRNNITTRVLDLATQFTTFRCPLLASATLKALRTHLNGSSESGGLVVVDKKSWQETITRVIEIAASVSESPDNNHPLDIICVWFEMLQWLANSNWKILPPTGPHISAVGVVIVVLEGRATALQQSLLEMKHQQHQDDDRDIQEVLAAEGVSNITNNGGDSTSSQPSSSSSDLGVKAARMVEKAGKNVKSSWSNFRESLKSKDGKGDSGVQSHPVAFIPEKEQKPGGGGVGSGGGGGSFKHLRSISETEAMQEYQDQRHQQSQPEQEHGNEPSSLSSTFNTQKLKKIAASIGHSIPITSNNNKPLVLTQKQSEELQLALIAAAVAGFIRAVLCPDISTRGSHSGSDTPGTPSHTNRVTFHHRTTSSVGREEAMMTALDNVVEHQGLVDSCEMLIERLGGRGRAPVMLLEYTREVRSLVSPGMSVNGLLEGLGRLGLIDMASCV